MSPYYIPESKTFRGKLEIPILQTPNWSWDIIDRVYEMGLAVRDDFKRTLELLLMENGTTLRFQKHFFIPVPGEVPEVSMDVIAKRICTSIQDERNFFMRMNHGISEAWIARMGRPGDEYAYELAD